MDKMDNIDYQLFSEIKDALEAIVKELHDISMTLDCISRKDEYFV